MTKQEIEYRMEKIKNILIDLSMKAGNPIADAKLANKRAELQAYATMWVGAK